MKEYSKETRNGREALVLYSFPPFNVWRDIGRLAGYSYDDCSLSIFEFLVSGKREEAEKILLGAMYQERV